MIATAIRAISFGWIALAAPAPAEAALPECVVRRAPAPPAIDGRGDDPAWSAAAPIRLAALRAGDPARETIVRLLWDNENLYVHARMEDPDIATRFDARDSSMWVDDVFEVFIDADGDGIDYLEFEISPKNALFDAFLPRRRVLYRAYDPAVRHKVRIDGTIDDPSDIDRAWEVEMAFPLAQILPETKADTPPRIEPGATWRANLFRVEKSGGNSSLQAWSPPLRGDFHELDRFGRWRFEGAMAAGAEPYRRVLASAQDDPGIERFEVCGRDLTPACPHAWSVRKRRLAGGLQEGVDVVEVDNGRLSIVIVPTRGMGIWSVRMGDVRLGWDSPVRDIVNPKYVNLAARGGLGWLDGFGEWLCRCGLESNGHPGEDIVIDNTGKEVKVSLTLHGKIANIPAREVDLIADREPPYRIRVRGTVGERMMFGPKLDLVTEISTVPGSNSFHIADEIHNASALTAEFQLIYHANFGAPLLEEGATFVGPVRQVTPFNDRAAEGGIAEFASFGPPEAGYVEKVFCLRLYGDAKDDTLVMLQNRAKDRAASMAFSLRALPYLSIWKNTIAVEDGYVTGIEPSTNYSYTRRLERIAGRVPKLAPGASHRAEIEVAIHASAEEVARVRKKIDAIQAGRPVHLDEKPSPPGP